MKRALFLALLLSFQFCWADSISIGSIHDLEEVITKKAYGTLYSKYPAFLTHPDQAILFAEEVQRRVVNNYPSEEWVKDEPYEVQTYLMAKEIMETAKEKEEESAKKAQRQQFAKSLGAAFLNAAGQFGDNMAEQARQQTYYNPPVIPKSINCTTHSFGSMQQTSCY